MNRGRPADLPPGNYQRPPRRVEVAGVDVFGEDGGLLGSYSFDVANCSDRLKADFASAFAAATEQGGRWRSAATCATGARLIRALLRFVATTRKPPQTLSQLSEAHLMSFALSRHNGARESVTRVLRPLLGDNPSLRKDARRFLMRRVPRGDYSGTESYAEATLLDIQARAMRTVSMARHRIETNIAALRGEASATISEMPLWLLEHLAQHGDVPRTDGGHSKHQELIRQLGGMSAVAACLFPTYIEVGAAAVLLICKQGWNASVFATLNLPDPVEDIPDGGLSDAPIRTVHLQKPRRGHGHHHMTNTLQDLGASSSGRVLAHIESMTAQARSTMASLGVPSSRLLLGRTSKQTWEGTFWIEGLPRHAARDWGRAVGLTGADGAPIELSMRRLRRTVVVTGDRALQQSEAVRDEVYVARDAHTREASAPTIELGLHDAVDHADAFMRVRIGTGDSVESLAAAIKVSVKTAEDLASGALDTPTGACLDFEHSPFSNDGPCDVSFLLCLSCPLAVVTDRHLPKLVVLHDLLRELRSAISATVWENDWADHWQRLTDLLDRYATDAERGQARLRCSDRDRMLIDELLHRRLDI